MNYYIHGFYVQVMRVLHHAVPFGTPFNAIGLNYSCVAKLEKVWHDYVISQKYFATNQQPDYENKALKYWAEILDPTYPSMCISDASIAIDMFQR